MAPERLSYTRSLINNLNFLHNWEGNQISWLCEKAISREACCRAPAPTTIQPFTAKRGLSITPAPPSPYPKTNFTQFALWNSRMPVRTVYHQRAVKTGIIGNLVRVLGLADLIQYFFIRPKCFPPVRHRGRGRGLSTP